VQRLLKRRIQAGPPGPTEEERARGRTVLWGEVTDERGRRAVARLRGPDGYTFTVRAALAVVERVLAGGAPAGFQTPSTAFGPDFVLGLEGVTREDE
jgi:saccharopine dehydrogenase (NAD+, L-lysine-forming)